MQGLQIQFCAWRQANQPIHGEKESPQYHTLCDWQIVIWVSWQAFWGVAQHHVQVGKINFRGYQISSNFRLRKGNWRVFTYREIGIFLDNEQIFLALIERTKP